MLWGTVDGKDVHLVTLKTEKLEAPCPSLFNHNVMNTCAVNQLEMKSKVHSCASRGSSTGALFASLVSWSPTLTEALP